MPASNFIDRLVPASFASNIFTVLAVTIWALTFYFAFTRSIFTEKFVILFIGLIYIIYMVNNIEGSYKNNPAEAYLFLVFIVGTLVSTYHMYMEFNNMKAVRIGYASTPDALIALMISIITIYLTYHSFGLPFLSVIALSLGYAYFGPYFPGAFHHTGLSFNRLLHLMATEVEGIYGNLSQLVAVWISLFILYAGLMQAYGAFRLILDLSLRTTKYLSSGVAQTGVIASMFIGSINGSATANTGITGSITIPLMKKYGLKPETAGGIEAVASTGGQIIPPVMGASAFLMANLIPFSYWDIVVASIVPAFVFYASLVFTVHLTSLQQIGQIGKISIEDVDQLEEKKTRTEIISDLIKYGVPFSVLIYLLGIRQLTVMTSALYTCVAMAAIGLIVPMAVDPSIETLKKYLADSLEGLKLGATLLAPIAIIIAAINAIVDILLATGIPGTIAISLIQLSGGILLIAAFLAVIICIILGLGMPTSAAYLVVAVLIAPALISQFGIPEMSAHYFVLYATILATITPPIATGVAVAAGIAGAGFLGTAKEAIRIGGPLYILPFIFIFHPEVINHNPTISTLIIGSIVLLGSLTMVYGFNFPNHFEKKRFDYLAGALFVILGVIIMVFPRRQIQILGIILTSLLIVSLYGRVYVTERVLDL